MGLDGKRRAAMATAVGIVMAMSLMGGGSVEAGASDGGGPVFIGEVDVILNVDGPDAPEVFAGLIVEVYTEDDLQSSGSQLNVNCNKVVATGVINTSQAASMTGTATCELPLGEATYAIGLDGVPDGWSVRGGCARVLGEAQFERLDLGGGEEFVLFQGAATCELYLDASVLLIDKVVVGGGPNDADDFTVEVLDGDTVVASGSDVADATCEADFDTAKCGLIALAPGIDYTIREQPVDNYELTSVECAQYIGFTQPPAGALQPIGDDGFDHDDGDTYCVVTNTYMPPPTTTTTTTTTPTTTTEPPPPTSAAPTTPPPPTPAPSTPAPPAPAPVSILPATGSSSTSTGWIAALGALFIAAGGAMVFVRRRPS
ncbi:MAG: LPXTG cell wall anchor domain-containing protein [Actinomycetota bacterium]